MFEKVARFHISRAALAVVGSLALLGGACLGQHVRLADARWLWLVVPFVVASMTRRGLMMALFVIILFGGVGMWRGAVAAQQMQIYSDMASQKMMLVGTADTDAVYGTRYQLTFTMKNATLLAPQQARLPGSLTIAGFGAPAIYKGDRVQVAGELYKARGNNVAGASFATLTVLSHHSSPIDTLRRKFTAGLQTAVPEPQASFGLGLLIGQRNTLPADASQALLMVGLTHVIAVSGYNLTIILQAVGRMLGKRSKFQYVCLSGLLMTLFLLLAGTSPSITRAAAVSGLSLGAWYYGRRLAAIPLLLVSAAITAYMNPMYVWGNVSWYLSFLAFFGVLVVAPVVTKRLYTKREPGLIAQVAIESLCAEAMTVPYVLHIFGQTSLVSLPANILIATWVPLAMLLSLGAGVAGMLAAPISGWFAWPAKLVLTYMLDVAHLLSSVPHAFAQNIGFSATQMIISYAIITFLTLMWWRWPRRNGIITDNKPAILSVEGAHLERTF